MLLFIYSSDRESARDDTCPFLRRYDKWFSKKQQLSKSYLFERFPKIRLLGRNLKNLFERRHSHMPRSPSCRVSQCSDVKQIRLVATDKQTKRQTNNEIYMYNI